MSAFEARAGREIGRIDRLGLRSSLAQHLQDVLPHVQSCGAARAPHRFQFLQKLQPSDLPDAIWCEKCDGVVTGWHSGEEVFEMKTVLKNIGAIVSGDLDRPILDGDTILIEDGRFKQIGFERDLDLGEPDTAIDAQGMTALPGLIDPHIHLVVGDWNPRQSAFGPLEGIFNGGVTTAVSQGSPYLQGRPKTASGTKALSLLLAYTFQNFRPGGGLKVHGGSVILETGLQKDDFVELHEAGVRVVAEIGGAGIIDPKEVGPMLNWVRDLGWVVPVHFGPKSVPASSSLLTADSVLRYEPDVLVHVNGGSTAAAWEEIEKTITQSRVTLEVIFAGNPSIGHRVVRQLIERDELHRLIVGSDTPTSHGVVPIAILRMVYEIASMHNIPPAKAWAFATGNVATSYKLDAGRIRAGAPADLLVMHTPIDSPVDNALDCLARGDLPAITLVMVDGRIITEHARNTRFSARKVRIEKYTAPPIAPGAEDPLLPALFRGAYA
jgi:enamidase